MMSDTDSMIVTIESEESLRALMRKIQHALRVRAKANFRDAQIAQADGNKIQAFRESAIADARNRNAELIGFVIDNLHSYEGV